MMTKPVRNGFSQIELLVVMSVIGLLVAIVVPAVQTVRESSRRVQCQSRIGDYGRAIQSFEATHLRFPPVLWTVPSTLLPNRDETSFFSTHAFLLPYLGSELIHSRINFQELYQPIWDPEGNRSSSNKGKYELSKIRIPAFICPSDAERFPPTIAPNNYRVCLGPGPRSVCASNELDLCPGPFVAYRQFSAQHIRDGLSQTVAASERLTGSANLSQFDRHRDMWYSSASNLVRDWPTLDQALRVCVAVPSVSAEVFPSAGSSWFSAGFEQTWYNHARTPNSDFPDCAWTPAGHLLRPGGYLHTTTTGIYSASSAHPGGVNAVLLDGSARFIADKIDLRLWRSLSTRSGAESLGDVW